MLSYYFSLQYRRLSRWLNANGVPPFVGIFLAGFIFVFLSKLLFLKLTWASECFILIAFSQLAKLSAQKRNNQLSLIFDNLTKKKIRLVENLLLCLPYVIYLLYVGEFYAVGVLLLLAIIFSFIVFKTYVQNTIPTPFKKIPFENIIGFRKNWWLYLLLYFIVFQSVRVDNFNLGLVALGAIFLVQMSAYFTQESQFLVWIYNKNPNQFLLSKVKDAILSCLILSLPVALVLLLFNSQHFLIILGVLFIGLIYSSSIVLAKYSAYPNEISLPQAILYAISLVFPPLLLVIMCIFYSKSKKNLNLSL